MDISSGFTHSTQSPVLLLLLAIAASVFVTVLGLRSRSLGIGAALCSSAFLVLLAGEHVPLVAAIAPRRFCFGDIGVLHILSFALPLATALIRLRPVAPVA